MIPDSKVIIKSLINPDDNFLEERLRINELKRIPIQNDLLLEGLDQIVRNMFYSIKRDWKYALKHQILSLDNQTLSQNQKEIFLKHLQ